MRELENIAVERRYDLDWLRVAAFGLLILYHIGMLYVERWGYHYKSAYLSSQLESLMLLVNPWRMALLWMVSGVATAYLLRKLKWHQFAVSRTVRLLLPLAFGLWVIVPPQLFVEMTANGDYSGSYLAFYRAFLDLNSPLFKDYTAGIWPHVDVNHLWYLRELWRFTLLLLVLYPLLAWLQRSAIVAKVLVPLRDVAIVLVLPLLMVTAEVLGALPSLGSDGDDRRIALGLVFFLLGYLITFQPVIWQAFKSVRRLSLCMAVGTYVLYVVGYHQVWLIGAPISTSMGLALTVLDHANRWFWLCALFGFSYQYLNRPHPWLDYLSPGVYTFYLVHQTIILLTAFCLAQFSLGPLIEPLSVITITYAACLAIYELVRRIQVLRPLFGLKWQTRRSQSSDRRWPKVVRAIVAALIVVPLGLEILF